MNITAAYPGGNIRVLSMEGDTVHLAPDLRTTPEDWFYWSFCVEGAQGRTIRFDFDDHCYLSYWGPAVSHDNRSWNWLGGWHTNCVNTAGTWFTYTFGPDEDRVYFCHDLNYQPERFLDFARQAGLTVETLCLSEKGNPVPMVRIGNEGPVLLTTSRHHCCESTGTYLMEGILREFAKQPPKGFQIIAIPFVDYDGVVAGDQGKSRAPHDHNRDYIENPVWLSTAAIMELAKHEDIRWALDLHAPWHRGHEHDHCYILRTEGNASPLREIFSHMLEGETRAHAEAFPFWHNFVFNHYWSNPGSFGYHFSHQPGVDLAMTIETTYAGHYGYQTTQSSLVELGACISRVLRSMYGKV